MQPSTDQQHGVIAEPEIMDALARVDSNTTREGTLAAVGLLVAQRRFLLRTTAVALVVGTVIAFVIPARYESTTRLMPPDTQSSNLAALAAMSSRLGPGIAAMGGDLLGLQSSGALFVGILQSRTVQDRLITRFDLRKVYGVSLWQKARSKLAENTVITEDRRSGIITITTTDHSPQRAAALSQAYVEELNRLVAELTTSAAHRERVFLEQRLSAVRQELESAEKEFSQFASKNTAIDIKEQGRSMVEAAAALQGQLIAAQSGLQGLREIYTDNNVRVRSVRARITELQHQLEKLGGKTNAATADTKPGESLYPSIRELPLLGVTYADMYRRTKVAETVFEALTQQYELAKVQEAKEIPSVKVIDPANLPERKSFPPRLLIMSLVAFLGFAYAVLWVLARARWRTLPDDNPTRVFVSDLMATIHVQRLWTKPALRWSNVREQVRRRFQYKSGGDAQA